MKSQVTLIMGKADTNKDNGSIAALVNPDQVAKIIWCPVPSHYLSRRCRGHNLGEGRPDGRAQPTYLKRKNDSQTGLVLRAGRIDLVGTELVADNWFAGFHK